MWPGVLPQNAEAINATYIAQVKQLIAIAAAEGLYTIIEPHQDELNPRFCGEGAPNWWVLKHTSVADFPVPVQQQPFPINPSRPCPGLTPEACPGVEFPGRQLCDLNSSFSYIWTHAGAKAYQTLWENAEDFATFWKIAAREFHGLPGVIGGELWNEPFPGDVFSQPSLRDNQHADHVNLSPFYTNVTQAIREVVPAREDFAVAFEPTWPVGNQDLHPDSVLPSTSGFESLPERNAIYAFHWYVPPADSNLSRYLNDRVTDAQRLQAAPFASEWNFGAQGDLVSDIERFGDTIMEFESRRIAYTGWQYKTFQAALPDGTCTGCGSAFFNEDGSMKHGTFQALSLLPFAQAVAGRVVSISNTPVQSANWARKFVLKYVRNPCFSAAPTAPTEIVISSAWLPKEELNVDVVGCSCKVAVAMETMPGASLAAGVVYKAWTRVYIRHLGPSGNCSSSASTEATELVTVTIQAGKPILVVS